MNMRTWKLLTLFISIVFFILLLLVNINYNGLVLDLKLKNAFRWLELLQNRSLIVKLLQSFVQNSVELLRN